MGSDDHLERGRESFKRSAWTAAHAQLSAADLESPLDAADLIRSAMAAYLIGLDTESVEILTRAHQESVEQHDIATATRCAFWIGFQLVIKGEVSQAGGWFGRGGRLLAEHQLECVEQGYLLIPQALQNLFGGNYQAAVEIFQQGAAVGERFRDRDLITLADFGRGQALIRLGRTEEGVALLDEIMVAVITDEVSAIICGLVYCGVIGSCQELFDLRRAREWTEALTRWCASQPDLVPYRGQCLVHRAQLMLLQGEWGAAEEEAARARDALSGAPDQVAIGMAFYELGELHRLQGRYNEAEEAYGQASQWGHLPEPGLAKLRLGQGQIDAAEAASRRVIGEAKELVIRCKVLP
ncbi:MAG: DNA-binding response regulator, partial [Actinomycetota bacterium]